MEQFGNSKTWLAAGIILSLAGAAGSTYAGVASYTLPEETAAFRPGPNQDLAQSNCAGCHSADYIQIQPRGPNFGKDFWQASVIKMINVYGAPIAEADVGKIVEYLATAYSSVD